MRSNVRSPTTACHVGSSSTYASRGAICSRPQPHATPVAVQNFLYLPCNLRGMISHPGLQEGHEKPPEGHATVQNAQKYPVSGYDQQRLAGASCRIQSFAGHLIRTMMGGIRLHCPPSSDAVPPLGRVVPHGLIENTPHLGSHADAQQPLEPRLVPTKEDRCRHLARTSKFFAVNNGLADLCS